MLNNFRAGHFLFKSNFPFLTWSLCVFQPKFKLLNTHQGTSVVTNLWNQFHEFLKSSSLLPARTSEIKDKSQDCDYWKYWILWRVGGFRKGVFGLNYWSWICRVSWSLSPGLQSFFQISINYASKSTCLSSA